VRYDRAMPRQTIVSPDAPKAIGPYAQAISVPAGRLVFCSGQIPLDPKTGELVGAGDIRAQTERVLANLAAVLAAAGASFADVTKTTIFLATGDWLLIVYGWGGNLSLFGMDWQPWMSVSVIAAYLAFFPVAVGALRGLTSPTATQMELLQAFAASWWQTLVRLRMPASVPYLIPALKLAAAAAVIGAIVAEISTGLRGGIGRLIISYAQQATGDPARVYAPIIGAAVMGLIAVGGVGLLDLALKRYHPAEAPS